MTSLQNLFVAKLPRNVTDAELEKIFESYKPKSAKVMLDAATGKSKGFGFVLFDSEEEGELAFKELNKTHVTLFGHSFNLCIFPSKHDGKVAKEVSNALYIRNVPRRLSQAEVEGFLRTFGNLIYCAMREDHYGSPVWVVYAEYETIEDAKNALNKLHGNSTYFLGSAALLAKFEDSEGVKRERRHRRREGVGAYHNLPSSGVIFPPRRGTGGAADPRGSAPLDTASGVFPSFQLAPSVENSSSSPSLYLGNQEMGTSSTPGTDVLAPPPYTSQPHGPATPAALPDYPPLQGFVAPSPEYCCVLLEGGQRVYLPSSSVSPSTPSVMNFVPLQQLSPLLSGGFGAHNVTGFPLLGYDAANTLVLANGQEPLVLSPDGLGLTSPPSAGLTTYCPGYDTGGGSPLQCAGLPLPNDQLAATRWVQSPFDPLSYNMR
ncbi:unnamed protein product [Phytomonas sp. EM1]|nr:unnamed protein product [Phytomonas sp. EM1]|eukprot:CCW61613.1 unnamed protein product [Phytomonas sp. isolate EM1]